MDPLLETFRVEVVVMIARKGCDLVVLCEVYAADGALLHGFEKAAVEIRVHQLSYDFLCLFVILSLLRLLPSQHPHYLAYPLAATRRTQNQQSQHSCESCTVYL